MTHALSIDTLHLLLATLAFITSTTLWLAVCVAAERILSDDASLASVSAECDVDADARFFVAMVATMLAEDFRNAPASVPARAPVTVLRLVSVGAPASVPAAATPVDASTDTAVRADRDSGIYRVPASMPARRASLLLSTSTLRPTLGYSARPPALDFETGAAYAFLAGYSVRTPRGARIPATVALVPRSARMPRERMRQSA